MNQDDEDQHRPTPDDALEPPDDIYSPELDEERLEEDNDTPSAPARPHLRTPKLPPNHPATDSGIDSQELYDEGLTSATDYDAHEEGTVPDDIGPIEPEGGYDGGQTK